MSEQASTSKGIATRYATAVFGLADEQDDIQTLEQNVGILKEALDKSMDLTSLISSPIYSRDQQQAAITAIAKKAAFKSRFDKYSLIDGYKAQVVCGAHFFDCFRRSYCC